MPDNRNKLEGMAVQAANETGQYLCLLLCEELGVDWENTSHQDCMQALNDYLVIGGTNVTYEEARNTDQYPCDLSYKQCILLRLYWQSHDLWDELIKVCPGHN